MQQCPQTETQSIYEHGLSVTSHFLHLITYLEDGWLTDWKVPEWLLKYRKEIREKLLPLPIIMDYTLYHDCGKPYCLTYDENGKKHFPNHAEKSYETWLSIGGCEQVAKLIRMDMMIHTIKAIEIDDFIKHPEAITLLLAGLAEIHSNAKMFGGMESDSFKIKWKHINKRGKDICQKLFRGSDVSIG